MKNIYIFRVWWRLIWFRLNWERTNLILLSAPIRKHGMSVNLLYGSSNMKVVSGLVSIGLLLRKGHIFFALHALSNLKSVCWTLWTLHDGDARFCYIPLSVNCSCFGRQLTCSHSNSVFEQFQLVFHQPSDFSKVFKENLGLPFCGSLHARILLSLFSNCGCPKLWSLVLQDRKGRFHIEIVATLHILHG